jgi:hypothetical protein
MYEEGLALRISKIWLAESHWIMVLCGKYVIGADESISREQKHCERSESNVYTFFRSSHLTTATTVALQKPE